MGLGILKILTPKVLKAIMKYVFEKNNLDNQMDAMQVRVAKLELFASQSGKCSKCKCKKREK